MYGAASVPISMGPGYPPLPPYPHASDEQEDSSFFLAPSDETQSTGSSPGSTGSSAGLVHYGDPRVPVSVDPQPLSDEKSDSSSGREVKEQSFTPRSSSWKKAAGASPSIKRAESLMTHRREKAYRLSKCDVEDLTSLNDLNELLARSPDFQKKYTIVSLDKVDNPVLTQQFESKMAGLELKAANPALLGSWDKEPEQETRCEVQASADKIKSFTRHKNVFKMLACHAIPAKFEHAILESGLDFLGKTDKGFFCQGTYFTTFPEYAADVYGGGGPIRIILICEVGFRILFPAASCDDLMGKSIKPGFDGVYAEVVQKSKSIFVSRNAFQKRKYDELVARDSSQILIKYVMRVAPKEGFKEIKAGANRKDLKEAILRYLEQHPSSDQFAALNQKLAELNDSMHKLLNQSEQELFAALHNALGEQDAKFQDMLGERISKVLTLVQLPEISAVPLVKVFPKAQISQEEMETRLKQGECHLHAGEGKKALAEFQKILKASPHCLRALIGCGSAFILEEKYDPALELFNTALQVEAKNAKATTGCVTALVKRAVGFGKIRKYEMAIKDLMQALALDPEHIPALVACASTFFAQGDFDQAFIYCGRALAIDRKCDVALRVRGAIFSERGWNEKALEDLTASIAIKPVVFSYLKRANVYLSMGNLVDAEKDCKEILKQDPENFGALSIRANINIRRGDLKVAEKDLKDCLKREPENLDVHSLYIDLYLKAKDVKQALKVVNKAIEIHQKLYRQEQLEAREKKQLYHFLLSLAQTHALMKSLDLAFSVYQRAIALEPNLPEAYTHRANLYRQQGEKAKAQEDYDKAVSLSK